MRFELRDEAYAVRGLHASTPGGGTVSGVLVVAAALTVAGLLTRDPNAQASEAKEIALTSKIAVEQPCA